MQFSSDNWAGAHKAISAALASRAGGFVGAYGSSELDRSVNEQFNTVFGRKVAVFFVGTGTAANALAMTACNLAGGVVFAHSHSHVIEDECGAVEHFTGGARLHGVGGGFGKIDPDLLEKAISKYASGFVHGGRPMAVTITQASEAGTVYSLAEIAVISAICRKHRLPLHMDGARFANAMVSLGASAAQMTVEAGVDLVSFGGTKNGCWCAEALVVLDPKRFADLPYIQKRAAQLFSKTRFIASQFDAYFKDGLWLELAAHANAMAARLAGHAHASPHMRLAWQPQANEVFVVMKERMANSLLAKGAAFYPWTVPDNCPGQIIAGETLNRFVTSFATTKAEVDAFGKLTA